ncbi:MAG: YceI family protein [Planctomycetota bacterium]
MIKLMVLPLGVALAAGLGPWSETGPTGTTPTPRAAATTYAVDTVHSSGIFRVKHAGAAYFYGRFDHLEGDMMFDPEDLGAAKLEIRVKTESVHTGAENRDKHLRGSDFLEAKQFPWATFTSSSVKAAGDDTFEVTGELELRGVKKPVTMTARHTGEGESRGTRRIGFETSFAIQRSDFGVSYGVKDGALGDEVTLTFGLEMVEKE